MSHPVTELGAEFPIAEVGLPIHSNSPSSKKIIVHKCGARLRVPASSGGEVVFNCTNERHSAEVAHEEAGYVMMADGTHRRYSITWRDEGQAVIRQRPRTPSIKTRKLKNDDTHA